MMADTTTPDGYLVGEDGSWVMEKQVMRGYVRTPYDNQSYYYDPDWRPMSLRNGKITIK